MWVEVVLGAALLFLLWQVLKKPSDLPPGRWGLPLVGYVPLPFMSLEDHLRDLYKKHGSVYIWSMGVRTMVFLHDQKMAREAFTNTDFIDRPPWQIFSLNEKSPKGKPIDLRPDNGNPIGHNPRLMEEVVATVRLWS